MVYHDVCAMSVVHGMLYVVLVLHMVVMLCCYQQTSQIIKSNAKKMFLHSLSHKMLSFTKHF
jgi:hypothetical protein